MDISVFGMGYVGAVCSACLAKDGHTVIGVDVSEAKVKMINAGQAPIVEPQLEEFIADGVASGRLRATLDGRDAVAKTELSMICVGTPSKTNGDLELNYIEGVCRDIGEALREKRTPHIVVVRSTVLPGTVKNVVIPALEAASGRQVGRDFFVATNPEFLRESTAIFDFYNPPMTVVGQMEDETGIVVASLYEQLDAEIIRKPIEVAEMVKYTCNVWHAAKVTFANEIGNIAKALGVDGREVMEVVCKDKKLNISNYYMRPGFAYGGSCLPKDVKALTHRARALDVKAPVLEQLMNSNENQIKNAVDIIRGLKRKKVAILGLSFKAKTDDLRESPYLELAQQIVGKGYDVKIYDQYVQKAKEAGMNSSFFEREIPHVANLLVSNLDEVIDHADVVVFSNGSDEYRAVIENLPEDKYAVDLFGFMDSVSTDNQKGICW